MGKVIVITSGKGGVGKSTLTANLGAALAKLGRKVCLVDGDTGLRNLDIIMGLENRVVYNLIHVARGEVPLDKALVKDKRIANLFLLATSQSEDKTAVSEEVMVSITRDLAQEFDIVLVDSPAGIEAGFRNAVAGADEAIVVVNPEVSSVRDSDRAIGLLESRKISSRAVINQYRHDMVMRGDMLSVDDVLDILAIELLGVVPHYPRLVRSTNRGEPLVLSDEGSDAAKAIMNIAHRLHGRQIPLMDFAHQSREGFFSRMKRRLFGQHEAKAV